MKTKKPTTSELIQQLAYIVECLGIERIRVGGFRYMFRNYPEIKPILDHIQYQQNILKKHKPYYGDIPKNELQ